MSQPDGADPNSPAGGPPGPGTPEPPARQPTAPPDATGQPIEPPSPPTGGPPGPGTPEPPARQPTAPPDATGQPTQPPAAAAGDPAGGYWAPGYQAPGYPPAAPGQWQPGQYPPAPKTDTNAIVAFVLSLVSWAVCPLIPAVIALVLANSAERAIREGAPMVEGRGLVTATRWISWINIAVWGLVLAFILFIALLAAVSEA